MESVSTAANGMRLSTFLSYEELNPFLAFTLIILTLIACYQTFLFKSPVALLLPKLPVALKVNVKSEDDLFIACADTAFNNKIKTILINEIGDYKSPWWYSPHLGTMIPFGCDHSLDFDREILHHEDGSCVAIDWFPSKPEKISSSSNDALPSSSSANGYKICIFLPCLGGHSDHKFAMNFALTLHSAGYHTAIVTTRGIGVPLRTSSAWHPAFSDDAYLTLHYIHSLYGHHAKLFFAGFSAGANIVTETLMRNQRAETSRQIPIIGALCVCLVGSYSKTRDELELTPMGKLYSFLMANKQKDILRSNEHAFRSISKAEMDTILWSNTLREFDNAAQKVLFGFETPEELDAAFSCRKIRDIAVPCMGIQPRDDPLHLNKVRENIPLDYLTQNPHFIYVEPSAGNHFGFYEGESITEAFTNTTSYTWPAKCALAFWEALLKDKEIDLLYNR